MWVAIIALILSTLMTLWFWLGFLETDPAPMPALSSGLLALGLGAFAMVPAGLLIRLTRTAWRQGFQRSHGLWSLFLTFPWIMLSILLILYAPIPALVGMITLILSLTLCLWALISLHIWRTDQPAA